MRPVIWASAESSDDIFGLQVSHDGSCIGCALSNGHIGLHSFSTGRLSYTLDHSEEGFPTTSLRFDSKSHKNFVAVSADGIIRGWSTVKGAVCWSVTEENQIFALDMSDESDKFATAGLDKTVRIYDHERREVVTELKRRTAFDDDGISGHTSRIYSVIFRDANTILSAGCSNPIFMWDVRTGRVVRSMFGANISSDSLDIRGNTLVSGSWRTDSQIQVWDLRGCRLECTRTWEGEPQCLVYATKIHPTGTFVAVGGSGANQVRLISLRTYKTIGDPLMFESSVSSICFSSDGERMIVGTQSHGLHCFDVTADL